MLMKNVLLFILFFGSLCSLLNPSARAGEGDDWYDAAARAVKLAESVETQPAAHSYSRTAKNPHDILEDWFLRFALLCAICAGGAGILLAGGRWLTLQAFRDQVLELINRPCRRAIAGGCPLNEARCWNPEGRKRWVHQQSFHALKNIILHHRKCSR
jgi:hypothetical protein